MQLHYESLDHWCHKALGIWKNWYTMEHKNTGLEKNAKTQSINETKIKDFTSKRRHSRKGKLMKKEEEESAEHIADKEKMFLLFEKFTSIEYLNYETRDQAKNPLPSCWNIEVKEKDL